MRLTLLSVLFAAALGCSSSADGVPTGTTCPTPDPMTLTWDNFGQQFMQSYCTACHSSELKHAQRNGAPLYHDYDSLMGVLEIPDHVDQYAGAGPDATNTVMPPSRCPTVPGGALDRDCPKPTLDERTKVAQWIACEITRPH